MNNVDSDKLFTDKVKIKRALISVTDKTNIEKIAKVLDDYNIEILSTGGTANFLKENAIPVKDVSDETNFPEILNGRVKTLHPKIHGGILSRRDNSVHIDQLQKHHIQEIDLLIINLYKFKETLKNNKDEIEIIENIDIGGPATVSYTHLRAHET